MQRKTARFPEKIPLNRLSPIFFSDVRKSDRSIRDARPPIKPRTLPEPAQGAGVVQFAVQACGDVDKEDVSERLSTSENGLPSSSA